MKEYNAKKQYPSIGSRRERRFGEAIIRKVRSLIAPFEKRQSIFICFTAVRRCIQLGFFTILCALRLCLRTYFGLYYNLVPDLNFSMIFLAFIYLALMLAHTFWFVLHYGTNLFLIIFFNPIKRRKHWYV